jgi:hypothetical protein
MLVFGARILGLSRNMFHYSQIHFTVPLGLKTIVMDGVSVPEPELLAYLVRSLLSSMFLSVCDLSLPCGLDEFWGAEKVESSKIVSLKRPGAPSAGLSSRASSRSAQGVH